MGAQSGSIRKRNGPFVVPHCTYTALELATGEYCTCARGNKGNVGEGRVGGAGVGEGRVGGGVVGNVGNVGKEAAGSGVLIGGNGLGKVVVGNVCGKIVVEGKVTGAWGIGELIGVKVVVAGVVVEAAPPPGTRNEAGREGVVISYNEFEEGTGGY